MAVHGLNNVEPEFKRNGLICWRHGYSGETNRYRQGFQSDSRLRGRKLIKPLLKSKSGFGDFVEEPKYVEFIIDVDDNGDGIYHTCDPSELNDFLGENAAWKFTLVYFNKQVLDKYYNETSKYTVEDSMVSCGLWSMKIDNHAPDKVCVFLDELGISLPHAEQEYWRAYNIPPTGGMSKTFFERNVEGKSVNSDQPDLLFKQKYHELKNACEKYLGWQLLKPLGSGDEYRLRRLRVCADEESHFKDSVSDLTCILIEALNEECLQSLIPADQPVEIKRGINRLESVLNFQEITGTEKYIAFLRCLWGLRTTRSSAHLEILDDNRYDRASSHFDLENLNRPEAFAKILEEAGQFLDFLISVVRSGKLSDKNNVDC